MLTFRDRHALTKVLLVVSQSVLERIRCAGQLPGVPVSHLGSPGRALSSSFLLRAQNTGVIYPYWMRPETPLTVRVELRSTLDCALC